MSTESSPLPKVQPLNKKVLFLLWGLCVLGFLAVIPYSSSLVGKVFKFQDLLTLASLVSLVQNILIYGLLILTGLYIARRIGLEVPLLSGWFNKQDVSAPFKAMLLPALLIGVVGAGMVILLDSLIYSPLLQKEMALLGINLSAASNQSVMTNPPVWQGLLASLYGGVNEEILLRLFVMTLIAGLIALAARRMDQKLPIGIFWVANIMAAVLFGLGHLPATKAIGLPMDFLVISRAILLNGLIGVGCGWLYWKHGFESAMLAHFSADIVLHVLTPLAASLMI